MPKHTSPTVPGQGTECSQCSTKLDSVGSILGHNTHGLVRDQNHTNKHKETKYSTVGLRGEAGSEFVMNIDTVAMDL